MSKRHISESGSKTDQQDASVQPSTKRRRLSTNLVLIDDDSK